VAGVFLIISGWLRPSSFCAGRSFGQSKKALQRCFSEHDAWFFIPNSLVCFVDTISQDGTLKSVKPGGFLEN
jgi:hypothetical protein